MKTIAEKEDLIKVTKAYGVAVLLGTIIGASLYFFGAKETPKPMPMPTRPLMSREEFASGNIFVGIRAGESYINHDDKYRRIFIGTDAGKDLTGRESDCPLFILNSPDGRTLLTINADGTMYPPSVMLYEFERKKQSGGKE